jgi:hypothetical protein
MVSFRSRYMYMKFDGRGVSNTVQFSVWFTPSLVTSVIKKSLLLIVPFTISHDYSKAYKRRWAW